MAEGMGVAEGTRGQWGRGMGWQGGDRHGAVTGGAMGWQRGQEMGVAEGMGVTEG